MNNTSFLETVAADILQKHGTNLSRVAIVFPNKRASLFMNDYLAQLAGQPIWSPAYFTISDLFTHHSNLIVTDPIKQVCDLHKVFVSITGIDETLDHFYGWGQLLLSDFDDIDKNMANADKVFANLRDLHELDDLSYLTPEQVELLKRFFGNFAADKQTELKERFLRLWCRFAEIYHAFKNKLAEQGLAYEGMMQRQVVEDESVEYLYEKYIFIGFNVLQQVEQNLFKRLQKQGRAHFYWDFDHYYLNNPNNEAGHYMRENLTTFGNELDSHDPTIYRHLDQAKDITYISAPTENVQARYVSEWLRENGRIEAGRRTAIVLADEKLLDTVIHCLPPEVGSTNITTGYPLSQSPVTALIALLINVQTVGQRKGTSRFRLKHVLRLLRHPYAQHFSPLMPELLQQLTTHKRLYPTTTDLSLDDDLRTIFTPYDGSPISMAAYLLEVLRMVGKNSHSVEDPLYQEALFRMYTLINRLHGLMECGDLNVDLATFERLLTQLIASTSIPFHGEPAEGIQIMGVLETRNIDFDHVLLLSCNEGNMPRGVNDASFIPYSVRKAYGLTTIDHKVAIYAYYFHRLLQRAQTVTLVYNCATTLNHTTEMSRFMMQLMVENPNPIRKIALHTGQSAIPMQRLPISKDERVKKVLDSITRLSPTAINQYLRCQKLFYYNSIAGLKEPNNTDDDDVDNRQFGNIFHRAAELIYIKFSEHEPTVSKHLITNALKDPRIIEEAVDRAFSEEFGVTTPESTTFTPISYNGLQLINRAVIIRYVKQLLRIDERLAPFTILGLEKWVDMHISIAVEGNSKQITVGGIIDRLDCVNLPDGQRCVRVVDYKTGRKPTVNPKEVADIFNPANISQKHTDYYLQTLLYACAERFHNSNRQLPIAPALLFIQNASSPDYNPILMFGTEKNGERINNIADHEQAYMEALRNLLAEIFDPSVPFAPTPDSARCQHCAFARLCALCSNQPVEEFE